jgi:hypothetical protein
MSKLKDTSTKGKQNRSMARHDGESDRTRKEAALRALSELGYEKVVNRAEGAIQETGTYDKDSLVGVPFVIVDVQHKESSEYPDSTYVVVTFLLPDSTTGVFADGGVGIKNQLQGVEISLDDPSTFVRVDGGLRKSEYTNQFGPGKTYYLSAHAGKQKLQAMAASTNNRAGARA